eukprot:1694985-Amphidinium_carterae.1
MGIAIRLGLCLVTLIASHNNNLHKSYLPGAVTFTGFETHPLSGVAPKLQQKFDCQVSDHLKTQLLLIESGRPRNQISGWPKFM